jgi:hypothetical protein
VESFRKDVPPNMLKVLRVMMAKNPADRFQQPLEVVEALSEWVHQPIDPPPAREMPQHCPLVRAIAGPSTPQPHAVPLARLLFSAPRALARGAATPPPVSASAALSQSTVTFGPLPGSSSHCGVEVTVPVGPASTARSSVAPTLPLIPAPTTPADAPSAAPLASVRYRSLRWPFWLLLAALLLLFAAALYLAYQLGRGGAIG